MEFNDEALGMHRKISRRDFMNGAAMTAAVMLSGPHVQAQGAGEPQNQPGYNPPTLTGIRGSHEGAYQTAHSLRDGDFWQHAGEPTETGEVYDLVVVGGGISGLSSARFFRKAAGPKSRVLILENHDDFGGHAKRNEFLVNGTRMLGFGGTYAIESPSPYSPVAKQVIRDLGIDVGRFSQVSERKTFASLGLEPRVFFDEETFGADRLAINVAHQWSESTADQREAMWQMFASTAPVNEKAKADLKRLLSLDEDYYPGQGSDAKKALLARTSYADYLKDKAKMDPQVIALLQVLPQPLYGLGIDAVSAQDAWGLDYPGFDGLKLAPGFGPGMGRDAQRYEEAEKFFFHFPDGNASIARLLVRSIVPDAVPGNSADDIITAQVKYDQLDRQGAPVRIRLNSTVVRVRHLGDVSSAKEVEIAYVEQGKLKTVRAAHCVLSCWHAVIPYICSEISPQQKQALSSAEKVPIVYTNVALRNWHPFVKLKTGSLYAPGSYFPFASLDQRVSIGDYRCTTRPDQPIVLTMHRFPCYPGAPSRVQHRAGRAELYTTPFETFERNIRLQLARSMGSGGFDPARDIAAITVNRWPHGYAYQYNSLWDSFWLEGAAPPCVAARQPFGRVSIANADADAYAYTDCAINQAHRAVSELNVGSA